MERVKDFLFDLSDIAISLVIVAVIFFVVSWKLNETMPMSFAIPDTKSDISKEADVAVKPPKSEGVQPATETTAIPVTTLAESDDAAEPNTKAESITTAAKPVTTARPVQPTTQVSTPTKRITIDIPSGSTGDAIAKILKSSGLIDDISAFNKTVEDLGLGNKLRAGSFTLSTDMTIETLARRIAGYKN